MRLSKAASLVFVAIGILFLGGCSFLDDTVYPVASDSADLASQSLNDWTIEDSSLNGAPLVEDKTVYDQDDPSEVTTFYVTLYPTVDDNGDTVTFQDFNKVSRDDLNYNPTLNVLIQEGDDTGLKQDGLGYLDTAANAAMRVRGYSSRNAVMKSYKIVFYESTGEWKKQTTLNLNKHYSDPTKVAQKFSMDMISRLDNIASLRTQFVHLYIRDLTSEDPNAGFVDYGLYTNTEQPNKAYLKSRGLDESGSLYKAVHFSFREDSALVNTDDEDYDKDAFEAILGIREGKDHSKLLQMLKDVNDYNQDFNTVFAKYFNKDNYLTWMAVNFLVGNEDTVSHNFMLYNPSNSMTWYFLPWDYDGTFRFGTMTTSVAVPDSMYGVPRYWSVVLHRRFLENPDNVTALMQKLDEVHQVLNSTATQELVDKYKNVLRQFMVKEPDLSASRLPPNEIEPYLDQFSSYIDNNYQRVIASLQYPMPVYTAEPERAQNGSVRFAWEASYDLQGQLLTYDFTLAKDPDMKDVVFSEKDYIGTEITVDNLPAGTYYQKLMINDEEGHSQYCAESFRNGQTYFGVRQFVIN